MCPFIFKLGLRRLQFQRTLPDVTTKGSKYAHWRRFRIEDVANLVCRVRQIWFMSRWIFCSIEDALSSFQKEHFSDGDRKRMIRRFYLFISYRFLCNHDRYLCLTVMRSVSLWLGSGSILEERSLQIIKTKSFFFTFIFWSKNKFYFLPFFNHLFRARKSKHFHLICAPLSDERSANRTRGAEKFGRIWFVRIPKRNYCLSCFGSALTNLEHVLYFTVYSNPLV